MNTQMQEIRETLDKIRSSERSLYTFIERMAKNETFKKDKPLTHKFFESLHTFRSVRGLLTDKQKFAINKEIDKNIVYFLTLRRIPNTISQPVDEPSIHPANDEVPLDESQSYEEAEREAMTQI